MRFIRVPIMVARVADIESSESMNIEPEWMNGFGLINLDEIESINGGEDDCTVCFKSGNSMGVNLLLDEFATILDSK